MREKSRSLEVFVLARSLFVVGRSTHCGMLTWDRGGLDGGREVSARYCGRWIED